MTRDDHGRTADEATGAVTPTRAARELELGRDEFRLAVQFGLVRTVGAGEGGRRRVERSELERLRAAPGFPAGLRERVRTVGTGEAAELLGIAPDRFTRLARTGHLSPVRFSLNRYRAVVWTYLAQEVADFGRACPALLTGRLPLDLRERLAAREDLRPRNWRARRLALLFRATDDPWAQASAIASLLDPLQVAEVVDDPYERAHLDRLRPPPPPGMPTPAAAREIAERLTRADDPDEILWHRLSLALALDEARAARPAPYPGERDPAVPSARRGGGVPSGVRFDVVPSPPPEPTVSGARPGAAAPWAVPVTVRGGPRALSAPTPPVPPPTVPAPPTVQAPPGTALSVTGPGIPASGSPASRVSEVPEVPEVPAVPVPAGRPVGDSGPPAGRPPSRPGRTRLLDRFRRGRAGGAARTRRRRGPVSWP